MPDLLTELLKTIDERVETFNHGALASHRITTALPIAPHPTGIKRWERTTYPAGYLEIQHVDGLESFALVTSFKTDAAAEPEDVAPVVVTKLQSPDRAEPYEVSKKRFASVVDAAKAPLDAFFVRLG